MAVLSPSAGLAAVYPHVYELGLRRLRDQLGLVPVGYPTTRAAHASLVDRAVGGDDQLTVIRHLDDEVLRANPRPFLGYSDNTNLLHHLHGLYHPRAQGTVAFHGGSVLVHLGRPGAMHPLTLASLRAALFDPPRPLVLRAFTEYGRAGGGAGAGVVVELALALVVMAPVVVLRLELALRR
ncbi:LD-carboxypeptidase [Solwaraspora sp. WMMD791]|uniref:LD-carboxypeptidase n=1 Tax=Solwaraspora sp. WMMD791 TaxID=3016086 RepID=UPI002499E4F9|nr:LD-carboxypeptidase [Solwaraspora sp. WMMD791]WFE25002.1 LD-carboxypeptidase [Solwaraspora sp. WMMD791]